MVTRPESSRSDFSDLNNCRLNTCRLDCRDGLAAVPVSQPIADIALFKRAMTNTRLIVLCVSACSVCVIGCNSATPDASLRKAASVPAPVTVRTALVGQSSVTPKVTLIGTVTAIRRSTVGSPVDGRVTQININEGDHVGMHVDRGQQRGDIIAQLDTETVSIEIAAAQAELTRLQHELAELNAGSRPEEIAQAKAHAEAAKDSSEYAESRFLRTQNLDKANVISVEQLDAAKSAAFAARQELIAANAAHAMAAAGPRQEVVAQSIAKVEHQKQEIVRLQTQLRHHTIRTPFAGDVVKKLTEVGQWLTRGAPLAEIIDVDPIDVVVHVPESLVTQIRTGDKVRLEFDALPDGANFFEGTIHGIVASADQQARTFPVRIRLNNPSDKGDFLLRDGMHARATVSGSPHSAILVPKDALILGGPKPVVMVAQPQNEQLPVAVRIEVEAGASSEDMIEITGDLQSGQRVIVDGNERVRPGQLLNVVADEADPS
jgi:HlyD family secretion protein